MSRLPVVERQPASASPARRLLQSLTDSIVSAAGDGNMIVVLIVFTAVCLLALNVDALAPDARLALRQLGPYP
jgi:hypothetical protein